MAWMALTATTVFRTRGSRHSTGYQAAASGRAGDSGSLAAVVDRKLRPLGQWTSRVPEMALVRVCLRASWRYLAKGGGMVLREAGTQFPRG